MVAYPPRPLADGRGLAAPLKKPNPLSDFQTSLYTAAQLPMYLRKTNIKISLLDVAAKSWIKNNDKMKDSEYYRCK